MVVLALLQGLAEALTQGQVTLRGGAVQELLDLVGAGPHLQGLGASAGGSLAYVRGRSNVSSRLAPESGLQSWGLPAAPHTPSPGAPGIPGGLTDSDWPALSSPSCSICETEAAHSPVKPTQLMLVPVMDSISQLPHNGLAEQVGPEGGKRL